MAAPTQIKKEKKSLLDKYQKDHSKDPFILKKGQQARELLQKSGYLPESLNAKPS